LIIFLFKIAVYSIGDGSLPKWALAYMSFGTVRQRPFSEILSLRDPVWDRGYMPAFVAQFSHIGLPAKRYSSFSEISLPHLLHAIIGPPVPIPLFLLSTLHS
jgi:hypothetical protein